MGKLSRLNLVFGLVVAVSLLMSTTVQAIRTYNDAPSGLATVADLTGVQKTDALTLAGSIARNVLYLLGLVFLILMVYAGIKWMTAKGDDDQVTKARDTVFAAVIGLAIVLASYALSVFVNDRILNSKTSSGSSSGSASPDSQGGVNLGCCVRWVSSNDGGISTLKAYDINGQAICEADGKSTSEVMLECTGPANGCWKWITGVTDYNDCQKN